MKLVPRCIYFAVFAWLAVSADASAQMVVQADRATLQPQIRRDDTDFASCGVRAIVIVGGKEYLDAYDFSLMVGASSLSGALKAGKLRVRMSDAMNGKFPQTPALPAPVDFWIAKESEGKSVRSKKKTPAETEGYILEFADLLPTYEAILAIINGERMQFAVRYQNQPVDVVVSFAATMPEAERAPTLACFNGVIRRMQKEAEADSSNPVMPK